MIVIVFLLYVLSGMALLLQVSTNVERDVGLMQVAAGMGFLVRRQL